VCDAAPSLSCSECAQVLCALPRATAVLCARRHRSLGIDTTVAQHGTSVCPCPLSSHLTTTIAARVAAALVTSGGGCLGSGPDRPGCVSPCCIQCRRYSASDTSRGNMDQSREPTKAVHASTDRHQSSKSPPSLLPSFLRASRWAACFARFACSACSACSAWFLPVCLSPKCGRVRAAGAIGLVSGLLDQHACTRGG
jgi:hypothetical protein